MDRRHRVRVRVLSFAAAEGTKLWKVAIRLTVGFLGLLAAFVAAAECSIDACSDVYVDQMEVLSLLMMAYALEKPVYIRLANGAR